MLGLTAAGFSFREIADQLGLSTETVKTHRRSVILKLGACNSSNAVALAWRRGILP